MFSVIKSQIVWYNGGMDTTKVYGRFIFMTVIYLDFEGCKKGESPASHEIVIMNDGHIMIYDRKAKTGKIENQQKFATDVYEVANLFENIRSVLSQDTFNNEVISPTTRTTDIRFRLHYSRTHIEECSPFLSNFEGVSVMDLIDGYIAFAKKEHTYYNWYEVAFNEFDTKGYSYFYKDDSIKIGDRVVVPTGAENKETVGHVINFWRIPEEKLPYPAEKTKWIIRKVED